MVKVVGQVGIEGKTMSPRVVFQIILAISALLSPGLVMAQHGAAAAVGHAQVAAPAHIGAASGPQAMHATGHITPGSRPGLAHPLPHSTIHATGYKATTRTYLTRPHANNTNSYSSDYYPAPGLGFDYVHYAAVHPYAAHERFRGGVIFPFFGSGIYYPATDYAETGAADGQATDAEPNGANAQMEEAAEAESQIDQLPGSALRPKPAPVPSSSEYIFVRRDGSVFFAVAYSWVNGDLQYVTKDGFRKLVSQGTLDLDATTQFNEQRGVAFHSPA